MPTVFVAFGFTFRFYSNDHVPMHIHVLKDGHKAKYSLFPVELVENNGFKPAEIRLIGSIVEERREEMIECWNKFFNRIK